MIPVLTAKDVKRQDADAEVRGIPVERLMENAGWAAARAARRMLGGTYGRRVVVVCGKGNNAGDGLVAGRILHEQGAHVTAVLVFGSSGSNELAERQLSRFHGRVVASEALERELARADLVIDAIFGVGLARAPEGAAQRAIWSLLPAAERRYGVLSVDVPSGIDSDTGGAVSRIPEDVRAVGADVTVTFGGYKPGLLFEPGRRFAGDIEVADIGTGGEASATAIEESDLRQWWPTRGASAHKRSAGTVLVVAGSRQFPGAAALAASASVHAGSGLTVLCATEDVCDIALGIVPEITTIPVPPSSEGTLGPKALDVIRSRFDELHSIAIGPGLTTHPSAVELVRALVSEAPVPIVIDADGLNALVGAQHLIAERAPNMTVLTPHAGELGRLVGRSAGELEEDRLAAAQAFARETGSTLVFKGPGTVTAARLSDGRAQTYVNGTGGSSLAQGGTGDVLTGVIASVVAQLTAPFRREVASTLTDAIPVRVAAAVWLHGRAADRLAARLAPHPANASALVDELGPALHEVLG